MSVPLRVNRELQGGSIRHYTAQSYSKNGTKIRSSFDGDRTLTNILVPLIKKETESLRNNLQAQFSLLEIDRSDVFELSQNDLGGFEVVVGDFGIADIVNQSSSFRDTFHLLKTAEMVVSQYMDERGMSGMFDERKFSILVSQEHILSNVTLLNQIDMSAEEWDSTENTTLPDGE